MTRRVIRFVVLALCVVLFGGAAPAAASAGRTGGASPPGQAPAAYRLGPELQISATEDIDHYHPAVAYDSKHGEYLVVWHQRDTGGLGRGIYVRSIAADGSPLYPPRRVAICPKICVQPAIAYNAASDEFLIVFMLDVSPNGDGSQYDIWDQVVYPYGTVANSPQRVWTWPTRTLWSPRVAANSARNEFLVVWNAFEKGTNTPTDIALNHVSTEGTPGPVAPHVTDNSQPFGADITYNSATGHYLVVWHRVYKVTDFDIYARPLDTDGGAMSLGEFKVDDSYADSRWPAVANSGERYLMVWQHQMAGGKYGIAGNSVNAAFFFSGNTFTIADGTANAGAPAVASGGSGANDFLVVWPEDTATGIALRGRLVHLGGPALVQGDPFELAPGGFWKNEQPAVAASPAGYFVAYEGDSAGDPTVYRKIYGRAWWAQALYLPLIRK